MVKVLLGVFNEDHGTIEVTSGGLVYSGPDPDHVRTLVERQREWWDRSGVKHTLTDEEVVRSLPYRRQGWSWAVFVDEQGVTQDAPP